VQAVHLTRTHRLLVAVVVVGAVTIAAIGFAGSFAAVRDLAEQKGFGAFAPFFPIGIDAGIVVLLALDLLLTWIRIPFPLLRQTAWLLTAATIAFNGAAAWPDALGVGMHAVIPVLFVVSVEAARHAIGRIADITADRHMEGVRVARWLLAFPSTFRLWRRMKLWELRSYDEVIRMEQDRLVYEARLQAHYGRGWRRKAPVESLMPLKLARYGVPLSETGPSGLDAAGIDAPELIRRSSSPSVADAAPAPASGQQHQVALTRLPEEPSAVRQKQPNEGLTHHGPSLEFAQTPPIPTAATASAPPSPPQPLGEAALFDAYQRYTHEKARFPTTSELRTVLAQKHGEAAVAATGAIDMDRLLDLHRSSRSTRPTPPPGSPAPVPGTVPAPASPARTADPSRQPANSQPDQAPTAPTAPQETAPPDQAVKEPARPAVGEQAPSAQHPQELPRQTTPREPATKKNELTPEQRYKKVLKLVRQNPDISAPDVARQLGLESGRTMRRAVKDAKDQVKQEQAARPLRAVGQ
jgi:uncharacterized protein DUF2637